MYASTPWVLTALIGMTALPATAQTAAEHSQHHPNGVAAAPAQTAPATSEQQISAMDKHLQRMRDMSRRLAEASTPQERQAILAEHHTAMQEGMKLMGHSTGMPSGGMGTMGGQMMGQMMQRHAMMEKRMEMLQTMMQMMMERDAAKR